MKTKEIDCTYAERHDFAPLYLTGQLSASDAEAFEAHYLGCARCWGDVRQGEEIRAALGQPALAPTSVQTTQRTGGDAGTLFAAAAALAMIAIGAFQLSRHQEATTSESTYRGSASSQSLRLSVSSAPNGPFTLSWSANEGARVYTVEVFTSDGVSVWKRDTTETTTTLRLADLPPRGSGISFFARVKAQDAMGRVSARSGLKPLSVP